MSHLKQDDLNPLNKNSLVHTSGLKSVHNEYAESHLHDNLIDKSTLKNSKFEDENVNDEGVANFAVPMRNINFQVEVK
jgi:hypothetical protein